MNTGRSFSTVDRHFGVTGLQTEFWFANDANVPDGSIGVPCRQPFYWDEIFAALLVVGEFPMIVRLQNIQRRRSINHEVPRGSARFRLLTLRQSA